MITLNSIAVTDSQPKVRLASKSKDPVVFTDMYQEETNIAIWQRDLSETLKQSVNDFILSNPTFEITMTLAPETALASISEFLGETRGSSELSENIAELVDMFAYLFSLKRVGLRMLVLKQAMCPKFHVDKVPCRLITTYQGIATEWLSHQDVDRTKLGRGSRGQSDAESGIYQDNSNIQQLKAGYVALLKGESWKGNENAGLVHRSPALSHDENRLLLTLDFSD